MGAPTRSDAKTGRRRRRFRASILGGRTRGHDAVARTAPLKGRPTFGPPYVPDASPRA